MTKMSRRSPGPVSVCLRVALAAGLLTVGAALWGVSSAGAASGVGGQSTSPSATAAVPTAPPTTKAQQRGSIDDPAARTMRWVIWGLVALGVVIAAGTGYFWVRTRPPLVDPITVVPLTEVTEPSPRPEPVTAEADVERSRRSVERWGETYAPLPSGITEATDAVAAHAEKER